MSCNMTVFHLSVKNNGQYHPQEKPSLYFGFLVPMLLPVIVFLCFPVVYSLYQLEYIR